MLSDVSVTDNLRIRVAAMLILLMVRNYKLKYVDDLHYHDNNIKTHEKSHADSKIIKCEQIHGNV
jgi:hypothetical protein